MSHLAPGVVTPALTINPRSDAEFVEFAEGLMRSGIPKPTELQDRLRERYPSAMVRPSEVADTRRVLWYVYRDGRWTGSD